ncbi:hypothetical protein [Cupriavidus taiwanensis]|uniref:hypothetical protein n=1 Tax=Cupriavidus taiwanensis TaxID=164546 RepID=UPI000E188A25|nr:hypothetical protein [Cupriavidus taiwanensis]SPA17238.1 exported hypothetical protein [Cupriavidus taiwanensis]
MKRVFLIAALATAPLRLHAQTPPTPLPTTITVTCPQTGPAIGVCAGLIVLMHEITKAANGEQAFGPNGEVMKLLKAPINIASGNVDGAQRESGDLAKAIRVTTGISLKDINEHGILGGPNSEARKVCNAIAGIGGGKC